MCMLKYSKSINIKYDNVIVTFLKIQTIGLRKSDIKRSKVHILNVYLGKLPGFLFVKNI